MANIILGSKTFSHTSDGRYPNGSVAFGSPNDYLKVVGGSLNRGKTLVTTAVSRTLEKDVTVNSIVSRKSCSVQLIISAPPVGFTSAEIATMITELATLMVVPANVTAFLAGTYDMAYTDTTLVA